MRSDERTALVSSAHLTDGELIDAYLLAAESRHLDVCDPCRARFEDLSLALQEVREDAASEADSIFTTERLQNQRDRIMRRIERHGHPAEVVRFPGPQSHTGMPRVFAPVRRWVAAAAAAGLAAGLFLGFTMDRRTHFTALDQARRPLPSSAPVVAWAASDARNDQFFIDIEDALTGVRTIELLSLDALTTPVEIREASHPR